MVVVALIAVVCALAALAVGAWLIAQLTSQSAEIDHRLTDLEDPERARERGDDARGDAARVASPGLQASTVLNDFALPNLASGTTTLSQWRGQRLALIFVHPDCPHSRRLVTSIADGATPLDFNGLHLVIVSSGDAETNRTLFGETSARAEVVLQEDSEVARVMRVAVTPAAYLVDRSGVTEGPLLLANDAILRALDGSKPGDERDVSDEETRDTTPLPAARQDRVQSIPPDQVAPRLDLIDLDGARIVLGPDRDRRTTLALVERLLATGRDIVQPHCLLTPGGPTFDRNGWRDHGRLHLDELRAEGDLVPLDTVGGTVLLVRADVHRDGLIFPAFPYGHANPKIRADMPEIETEGLGIMDDDLGPRCWGMLNLEVIHRDD